MLNVTNFKLLELEIGKKIQYDNETHKYYLVFLSQMLYQNDDKSENDSKFALGNLKMILISDTNKLS